MKRVIDADNMKVIDYFNESDTQQKVQELIATGRWEEVSVDRDGEIVCWKKQ